MGVGYKLSPRKPSLSPSVRPISPGSSPPAFQRPFSPSYSSPPPGNPVPHRWKLIREQSVGHGCVVMLNYPDCDNYEGNKILVYRASSFDEVRQKNKDMIDPHFFDDDSVQSPVARFEPTEEGWRLALKLAGVL